MEKKIMSMFVGIDNGLNGCVAILETGQKTKITLFDTPTVIEKVKNKIRRRYNVNLIADFIKQLVAGDSFAILENVIAMPDQSSMSTLSIGRGFGMFEGMLSMQFISYEVISSRKWQKEYSITGDTKSQAFQVATRLFPKEIFSTPRGRILDGRCDAILMAEYGRRKKCGELENKE
jgi:hypothetical protein